MTPDMAVRRLTPVECERLQGFPDGHTNVPYRGKPAADGPRYKAIGNSMAVPCMRFIGASIDRYMSWGVECPECDGQWVDGSEEAEFIGWHGHCAECALSGWEADV